MEKKIINYNDRIEIINLAPHNGVKGTVIGCSFVYIFNTYIILLDEEIDQINTKFGFPFSKVKAITLPETCINVI